MNTSWQIYSVQKTDLQYAYYIKYGGKVCKICGMFNNLKNYKCTKCCTSFKDLLSTKELESLSLEYQLFDS
jgi:transposase-like protein